MINEVLTKSTPAGEWIKDFVDSDNPKFAGKSAAKRKQMALAAYYAKKNESVEEAAAVSQNSTAMQDMNEDHLVHVNDGSKYDEQPHEKDVEHVMAGVKLHGGEHAGASDKGVFFKFKSPEHASSFISHVNKCPHRSCDAHMSESVEYKGIGTDVVDKKKKLNPQPNFTMTKKTVKDFKEEAEPIDELSKGLVARYANKAAKTTQANYDKSKDKFQFSSGRQDGMKNAVKRLTKEEAELIDELSKDTLSSYAKKASHDARIKQHVAADFKSKEAHARNPRKKETWGSIAKKYQSQAWKREKGHDKAVDKLKEETLDELNKSTLKSYVNKAEKEEDKYQQNYSKLRSIRDTTHGKFSDDTPEMKHLDKKYVNRANGVHIAKQKLAKEEAEQIDESSLHRQHFQMVADLIRGHESAEKRKELAHHHAELFKKANPRFDHAKFMKAAGVNEEVELIAKHEVKADAPHKTSGHVILTKSSDKWHVLHNKKSSPDAKDLHRSKLLHSYDDEKAARAKFKELKEEQIDEISKSTLARYIPSAARDVGSHTYSGKEAGEWANHYTRAGDWSAAEKHSKKSYADFKKANKRIAGIDKATKKLATQKEEVQVDEAIAKKLPVQHAVDAVHKTLGPKSATRFLSHLSPGSDKHTTWDKVNDALVKQGVQTHHIASIAQKTSHMNEEVVDESRGHKVLATFFKNREVAQRAYQGNPARDSEVAAGGGSPAEQGIAAAKADYKKMNKIKEDQYTSEYKIKQFVDPVTGENKTRKIRPHRVNFKSSKMNAVPAQDTDQVKVNEGHDDYSSIAKELVKKHGKNVTAQHVKDFAGQRDTHRGLDHAEVMHHVKKLSEDDKIYDEKWKKFTKGAK